MSARRHKNKKTSPLIALLLAVAIGGGLFALWYWEKLDQQLSAAQSAMSADPVLKERLSVYTDDGWYCLRENQEAVLILGIDKLSERLETLNEDALINNLQSDFLMLLIVDHDAKTCTALHLNRDTMCEIPRIGKNGTTLPSVTEQLALSHSYGSGGKDSCRNSVKAVSRLLYDVPVDHYFALTMDAIPVLTDHVGGVPVYIEEDLTPADPAFTAETNVVLHGNQALAFVRTRTTVSDGSNLSRMERQRVYLSSLQNKLLQRFSSDGDSFIVSLAETLSPYTVTSLSNDELFSLADCLQSYDFTGSETTPGAAKTDSKSVEFYPDEEALKALVLRLFFMKNEQ